MRSIHMAGGMLISNLRKARKILHAIGFIEYDVIDHLFYQPYAYKAESGNMSL